MGISYTVYFKEDTPIWHTSASATEHADFAEEVKKFGDVPILVMDFLEAYDGTYNKHQCRIIRNWLFKNIQKIPLNWKFQHYADLIQTLNVACGKGKIRLVIE